MSPPFPAPFAPQDPLGDLQPADVIARLTGVHLLGPVHVARHTASTMADLATMADGSALPAGWVTAGDGPARLVDGGGAPEGTVVIADFQAAGRGRLGRAWIAPPGTALLMSVLLRPTLNPLRGGELSMALSLAVLDAIVCYLPPAHRLTATLKWPNDVLVAGRKIGGLLAEASWPTGDRAGSAPATGQVILGVGLNVRQGHDVLPEGATSLAALGGDCPPRAVLAAAILNRLDGTYSDILTGRSLTERWADRLGTLGHTVAVTGPTGITRGQAIGVAPDGALRVRASDGRIHELRAGDVTLGAKP